MKDYEVEADSNALSLLCLSCRQFICKDMVHAYEQNCRLSDNYLSKEEFLSEVKKPFEDEPIYAFNTSCPSCKFQYYTKD